MNATLFVLRTFQHAGHFIRAGEEPEDATITVPADEFREERDRGRNPETGRWLSGLLNHCEPADQVAAQIFEEDPGTPGPPSSKAKSARSTGLRQQAKAERNPEVEKELEELWAEFDAIGKAYDRRWSLARTRQELTRAKKEVGG